VTESPIEFTAFLYIISLRYFTKIIFIDLKSFINFIYFKVLFSFYSTSTSIIIVKDRKEKILEEHIKFIGLSHPLVRLSKE